ncbi:unnamed protein product [Caenorhabditis angaria]|uniref:Uncharacterized protein n=1 Tax=Caenorhabditis angaria TaxID=860376 RepID=A0A9P1IXU6_9PELO|nr:unnamed protein product [Caenorhabditis angaria]
MKLLVIFLCFLGFLEASSMPRYYFEPGQNAKIYIGTSKNLKRSVGIDKPIQVYRVCNGNNKKTCGFWENTKNKKKVAKAPKTVKKEKVYLVLRNITTADSGVYYNDNGIYLSIDVLNNSW